MPTHYCEVQLCAFEGHVLTLAIICLLHNLLLTWCQGKPFYLHNRFSYFVSLFSYVSIWYCIQYIVYIIYINFKRYIERIPLLTAWNRTYISLLTACNNCMRLGGHAAALCTLLSSSCSRAWEIFNSLELRKSELLHLISHNRNRGRMRPLCTQDVAATRGYIMHGISYHKHRAAQLNSIQWLDSTYPRPRATSLRGNSFPTEGMKSTVRRLSHLNLSTKLLKVCPRKIPVCRCRCVHVG